MKNLLKNVFIGTLAFGMIVVLGGCSSSSKPSADSAKHKDVEYVQTHQDDKITSIHAKMYQKNGKKDKMGEIKFAEEQSGLQMTAELKDVRPDAEYTLSLYKVKDCKKDKKSKMAKCDKTKIDADLPTLKGDKDGKVHVTYMITGLTAAELDKTKVVLSRKNDKGEEVHVGWGMLKHGMMF